MIHRSGAQGVGESVGTAALLGRAVETGVISTVGVSVGGKVAGDKLGVSVGGAAAGSVTTSVEAAAGTQAARPRTKQNEPTSA